MVIDDESSMREMLRDFLKSRGYRVDCFASGEAALRKLRMKDRAKPWAIISDIKMDPTNGIELLRAAKRDFPTIPVLLYTGAGNHLVEAQALQAGALHYLAKPFQLATLERLLKQIPAIRK